MVGWRKKPIKEKKNKKTIPPSTPSSSDDSFIAVSDIPSAFELISPSEGDVFAVNVIHLDDDEKVVSDRRGDRRCSKPLERCKRRGAHVFNLMRYDDGRLFDTDGGYLSTVGTRLSCFCTVKMAMRVPIGSVDMEKISLTETCKAQTLRDVLKMPTISQFDEEEEEQGARFRQGQSMDLELNEADKLASKNAGKRSARRALEKARANKRRCGNIQIGLKNVLYPERSLTAYEQSTEEQRDKIRTMRRERYRAEQLQRWTSYQAEVRDLSASSTSARRGVPETRMRNRLKILRRLPCWMADQLSRAEEQDEKVERNDAIESDERPLWMEYTKLPDVAIEEDSLSLVKEKLIEMSLRSFAIQLQQTRDIEKETSVYRNMLDKWDAEISEEGDYVNREDDLLDHMLMP